MAVAAHDEKIGTLVARSGQQEFAGLDALHRLNVMGGGGDAVPAEIARQLGIGQRFVLLADR